MLHERHGGLQFFYLVRRKAIERFDSLQKWNKVLLGVRDCEAANEFHIQYGTSSLSLRSDFGVRPVCFLRFLLCDLGIATKARW